MKITAFALLLILSVTPSKAQDSQTGFNFLRLPVSAHAAAIGGDTHFQQPFVAFERLRQVNQPQLYALYAWCKHGKCGLQS